MKILIAGDFFVGRKLYNFIQKKNFSFLQPIKELTQEVDVAFVNFEGPIAGEDDKEIVKNGPNIRMSIEAAEAVRYAGFTHATLANNHILDYGVVAMDRTENILNTNGIKTIGIGRNLMEASKTLYLNDNKETIAIINCCENEFSLATDSMPGANHMNPIRQYYEIQEAKKKADRIIMIIHGGPEMYKLPTIRMQQTYRFFIDAGADAIVNHHQHVFSGYEIYNGKPIIYGIGNLFFSSSSASNAEWHKGYIVIIDTSDLHITLHPYEQYDEPIEFKFINDQLFFKEISELNKIIADPTSLKHQQEVYYSQNVNSSLNTFEPFSNRIIKFLRYRGLLPRLQNDKKILSIENAIMCESHRDKLEYAFRQKRENKLSFP